MIHPIPSCAPSPTSTVCGAVTSTILVLRPNTDTERDVARKKVQTTSFILGLLERWILLLLATPWRWPTQCGGMLTIAAWGSTGISGAGSHSQIFPSLTERDRTVSTSNLGGWSLKGRYETLRIDICFKQFEIWNFEFYVVLKLQLKNSCNKIRTFLLAIENINVEV